MAAGDPATGDSCALYYNSGTHAVPVWVEITKARDVAWPIDIGEAEANARDCEFKLSEPTLIGIELNFGYQYTKGADTVYDLLLAMALARTDKQFAVADGPIATVGTRYLKMFAKIFGVDNQEPLEGNKTLELTLKPNRHEESGTLIKPSLVTVA